MNFAARVSVHPEIVTGGERAIRIGIHPVLIACNLIRNGTLDIVEARDAAGGIVVLRSGGFRKSYDEASDE
jgi:hypothetical protein